MQAQAGEATAPSGPLGSQERQPTCIGFHYQSSHELTRMPTCGRARRASVPTGLRARGRGACGTRLGLHQQRCLHSDFVAAANWRRPTGTATRHACRHGWRGSRSDQASNVHFMPIAGREWLGRRVHIGALKANSSFDQSQTFTTQRSRYGEMA